MAIAGTVDKERRIVRGRTLGVAVLLSAAFVTTGCVTPATNNRTINCWAVSGDSEVLADSSLSLENTIYSAGRGDVRLTSAINETVAFQLVAHTPRPPAGPFELRVSDLSGVGGTLSARDAVRAFRARYIRVDEFPSWYPEHAGRPAIPMAFPDILVPWDAPRGGGPLRLDSAQNQIIWIDIHVPLDAAPGTYVGRIELLDRSENAVFATGLHLTVAPVTLPDTPALPMLCRIDPRDLLEDQLGWPRTPAAETRLLPKTASHTAAIDLANATMSLFAEHRTTPIFWAAFPKFRPADDAVVELDWQAYDEVIGPWIDRAAAEDRAAPSAYALPASIEYPDAARNGGFESARYARLLAAYLRACETHFEQRGWLERAFVRLSPPAALNIESVRRATRTGAIVEQADVAAPLVAHLPGGSLRIFGWYDAPLIEQVQANIWAPPAQWFEPDLIAREQALGKQAWFIPDKPPFSPSLAVGAPSIDPRAIAWQAYRYALDGVWTEHAAEYKRDARGGLVQPGPALVYPGSDYGLKDRPVPSMRLKRLRRGLQDFDLLRLLETSGKPLLAKRTAEQVVRWAFTDACVENLVMTRLAGWSSEPDVYQLARRLLLQDLINESEPSTEGREVQIANLADWSRVLSRSARIEARVAGVRLEPTDTGFSADVFTEVSNGLSRQIQGVWRVPELPVGWTLDTPQRVAISAGSHTNRVVPLSLASLTYDRDGVYPFEMALDVESEEPLIDRARLAVAACPALDDPPRIDGNLDEWPTALNNSAGDFRLVRGERASLDGVVDRPTLATRAFFAMDDEHLYIAIHAALAPGERPAWETTNSINVDGAVPWGQDLVEILLSPENLHRGTGADLYCLQIKPSGLLIARRGCLTDPPMNPSALWESAARVAVRISRDAWTVELAIPFVTLPEQGLRNRVWGCNVTRLDSRRGEYASWSGARGSCYAPSRLGNLYLLRP